MIKILDNKEEDVLNEYKQEEVPPKIDLDQMAGEHHAAAGASEQGETRRSGQVRVANRQFEDYGLYVTVEEEEVMPAMMEEDPAEDEEDEEVLAAVGHYIMVHYKEKEGLKKKKKKYKPKSGQYQLEAGIKRFGKQGETAVTKELDQLNKYGVFEPKLVRDLSEEDKKKVLSSPFFLKEKKSGVIKARSCAIGSPQREHIVKEEAAAPTVALESVFITSTIDAKESRKVVTVDVPGAFLHADNKDYVIMKMVGTLAELMVKTNPKIYQQYVMLEKGRSVLYLQLQKALYGMMKSALLFYRKLVSELQEMGFEINPYDPCVANKTVNRSQMTIRWHVNDLMISHLSQEKIMKVVQGIKDIYGESLAETVGTVHDYLGMTFDYSFTKEVRINMWDYLRKVIKEFPKEITGVCATPASDHLFKVQEDGRKLSEEYWGKLVRILKYLNGTRYMTLILSADKMKSTIHWYVDGSHQVHKDCRGQIGCLMTMGNGAVISSSNAMNCNTRSSTEMELISIHNKLPDIIWTRYFIEGQGYNINKYMIFQDNMSSLSLEKNGRVSSSKRMKHIKAKYFLIKDYYNSGEIDLRYCQTDVMWADALTKPLQG